MPAVRVLLLTAVFPEARALARAFQLVEANAKIPYWVQGELALAVVGVRAVRLGGVEGWAMGGGASPKLIIMAGVAGALSPALRVGDVVVEIPPTHLPPLPPLSAAYLGRLHTSGALAATPRQKAHLFATTGCLAVDMETAIAKEFAAKHGAAFLAVRGISDTVTEGLDPALLTLVDASGRPRVGRAMAMLCRHPGKLRSMLRLQRGTAVAMRSVADILRIVIASEWPEGPQKSQAGR